MTNTSKQRFEERLERFRVLTRDEAMNIKDACARMGITQATGTRYETALVERTGLTRQQHLLERWHALTDQGYSRTQAAAQLGIPPKTFWIWDTYGTRRRTNPRGGDIAQGHAAHRARREERIEAFRVLTRDQHLRIKDACAQIGIAPETGSLYERELVRRTGLTREQHWLNTWRELRTYLPRAAAAKFLKIDRQSALRWDRKVGLTSPQELAA